MSVFIPSIDPTSDDISVAIDSAEHYLIRAYKDEFRGNQWIIHQALVPDLVWSVSLGTCDEFEYLMGEIWHNWDTKKQ